MDPAELDRWTVFDVEPSIEDWLDHAKGKVLPIVWDFINQDRAHLEFKGEYEPNKVFPSRRSWFRLNDCLATGKLLEGSSKDFKHNLGTVFELATAFVGFEAAVKFRDFAEKYESQVTVDDIMNGRHDAMETWGINDHVSMIDKVIASEVLKKPLDAKTIKHLADWGRRMPGEALMKLWKSVGPQNIKNAVNLHNALGNHIVEIMTGGNAEKAPEKK